MAVFSQSLKALHAGKKIKQTFWNNLFVPENRLCHFMQILLRETICMKCQSLFSEKNKANDPPEFYCLIVRTVCVVVI